VQKKPVSKVMMYGIAAVALLAIVGIAYGALSRGRNNNALISTPTTQAVAAPATEAPVTEVPVTEVLIDPTLTDQPTLSPSVSRPTIDGLASETEWVQATVYDLPHGKLYYQNDDDYLYVLIDLIGDTGDNREGLGADSFSFTFDVNENKVVDANKDFMYGFAGGDYSRFGIFYYLDCRSSTGINPSNSEAGEGFGPSFSSTIPHRIWELALALDEIQATPSQRVRFGIVTFSGFPQFLDNIPESLSDSCDFSKLVEIDLERP
jgi:hypothetical protein